MLKIVAIRNAYLLNCNIKIIKTVLTRINVNAIPSVLFKVSMRTKFPTVKPIQP